ncbi:hypothetical protein [Cryptosporidium hominis TU502]|uniref:hypothetical protein n=1 Tax=Cryptosporidium hominis (strain TU502) TaxID=353151 RepID=UPI000045348E|nr:hypothetical protein [Cryptosporidium hominis TU502]
MQIKQRELSNRVILANLNLISKILLSHGFYHSYIHFLSFSPPAFVFLSFSRLLVLLYSSPPTPLLPLLSFSRPLLLVPFSLPLLLVPFSLPLILLSSIFPLLSSQSSPLLLPVLPNHSSSPISPT